MKGNSELWRLLDLGAVDGYTMTNLYEAVGKAVSDGSSPNTVILNHPERPFVNIGYHQIMEKEINVSYVREMGFDLVRRSIGGGAILDGPWEQDYFIVINRRSQECPATIPDFYESFLRPTVSALRYLGLRAEVRKPNDVTVNGKKISGNGAITIDSANVLAGDLLMETPADLMSRIINAPSEKFADKLAGSMAEWLTSLERELGHVPEREIVKKSYVEAFEEALGIDLVSGVATEVETMSLQRLVAERRNSDWIFEKDNELRGVVAEAKATRVMGGVAVCESVYKAAKLIRVTYVARDERIEAISLSGDFFTEPYVGAMRELEEALVGAPLDDEALRRAVGEAFAETGVKVLGANPDDFASAIIRAKRQIKE